MGHFTLDSARMSRGSMAAPPMTRAAPTGVGRRVKPYIRETSIRL